MSDDFRPGYDYFTPPPVVPSRIPSEVSAGRPGSGHPVALPAAPGSHAVAHPGARPAAPAAPGTHWAPRAHEVALGRRLPRWGSRLITAAGLLLVGSLVIAAGIPMLRRHQLTAQFTATSIHIPATFNGVRRQSPQQVQAALKVAGAGFASTQAGLYGSTPLTLVLIVAARPKKAMSLPDQARARTQFQDNFASSSDGAQLDLAEVPDAGLERGWFGCGPVSGVTVCVATDPGSLMAVVMGPGTSDPQHLALTARAATITRT